MKFYQDATLLGLIYIILILVLVMIRGAFITPHMDFLLADAIIKLVLIFVILGVAYAFVSSNADKCKSNKIWAVGIIWSGLLVTYEIFSHFIMHIPWTRILQNYNLIQGRLMLLVFLTLLFSPIFFYNRSNKHD